MEGRNKVYSCRKRKRTFRAQKVCRHQQQCAAGSPQDQGVHHRSKPSTPADFLHSLALKPQAQPSSASPDLQVQSITRPSTRSSRALNVTLSSYPTPDRALQDVVPQCDAPLMIHGYSVDEYKAIYHSVVDDMLKYKSGRLRPYTLKLGRNIKQRLWERLGCPKITETETPEGLLQIGGSTSKDVYPPIINVDISHEPDAWKLFKRNPKLKRKRQFCDV